MIQLDNQTPWSAGLYPGWSRQRQRQQTLVVKIGYRFDQHGQLSPCPQPLIESDEYRDNPEASSLTQVTETVPFKQGAELYLYGSAQPGNASPGSVQVEVGLRYDNNRYWSKDLLVFGPRQWERKLFTVLPGHPQTLTEPVELIYENAYGGQDPQHPDESYQANPAGCGYSLRGLRSKAVLLPQLEQGPQFIASPASRVRPAGFGPLPAHWAPRCNLNVAIDSEAIASGTCPFGGEQPADLYNCAPMDQRMATPFAGAMTLKLTSLVAAAPRELLLEIPEQQPLATLNLANAKEQIELCCDTLIIDSDQQTMALVFRGSIITDPDPDPVGWLTLRDGHPLPLNQAPAESSSVEQRP